MTQPPAWRGALLAVALVLLLGLFVFVMVRPSTRQPDLTPQIALAPAHRPGMPPTGFRNPNTVGVQMAGASLPTQTPLFPFMVRVPYDTLVRWYDLHDGSAWLLRVRLPTEPDRPPELCFSQADGGNPASLELHRLDGNMWDTAPYVNGTMLGIIRLTLDVDMVTIETTEGRLDFAQ